MSPIARTLCMLAVTSAPAVASAEREAPVLAFEAVAAWQQRNDVQIPNEPPNTRFALDDVTGSGPFYGGRVALDWPLTERQRLRFLIAPLRVDEDGALPAPVVFQDTAFAAGPASAKYRFDSYRVSWRWRFHDSPAWVWDVGATLNVRDAEVQLSQGGVTRRRTDTGFVPLLALEGQWRFAPRWRGVFDFEGLAAPQGRAFDVALKLAYEVTPRFSVNAGYRLLDGGADNDDIYTFARFDQAVLGVTWALR
jgi:hypothetical protein